MLNEDTIRRKLLKYMRQSFYQVDRLKDYIDIVRNKLKEVGIKVSKNPIKFYLKLKRLGFFN